jgi:hypothetical protein
LDTLTSGLRDLERACVFASRPSSVWTFEAVATGDLQPRSDYRLEGVAVRALAVERSFSHWDSKGS